MSHVQMNVECSLTSKSDEFRFPELENIQQKLSQVQLELSRMQDKASSPPVYDPSLARLAKEILRSRRRRDLVFGNNLFGEPAWEILLEVYFAQLTNRPVTVSSVCDVSAVSATTALRWVTKLEKEGWLERRPDPADGRRYFVELTCNASEKISTLLSEIAVRAV